MGPTKRTAPALIGTLEGSIQPPGGATINGFRGAADVAPPGAGVVPLMVELYEDQLRTQDEQYPGQREFEQRGKTKAAWHANTAQQGFILALALHRLNIPSTVFEARSENYKQGGGLMLSPNALRALESLGLYERLRVRALQFDKLHFKNDKDETTDIYYFGSKVMYGYPAVRVMRKELLGQKPRYAGILGISCVVQRSQLRIPKDYGLPAIAMGKPGGLLVVPQKPDGSEVYVGAQRPFVELDDWNILREDKQKLYDMVHENQFDWPDVIQSY
ncbi:uncharacterized protein F4822DRAFT_432742 [Hypoxylon trugodes]|uniref:uncharacterized protein n=1 Tax=Hypoxylon trugodes TaxID=326681 RepID=UPI002199DA54|nr:uncharacterized protein F4822DRAFT_432742 [Hypoxylon trugodes]KAI1385881.1 hypothetical protein F4822DRAFT_432742 [Hypoxylon trugodes]